MKIKIKVDGEGQIIDGVCFNKFEGIDKDGNSVVGFIREVTEREHIERIQKR